MTARVALMFAGSEYVSVDMGLADEANSSLEETVPVLYEVDKHLSVFRAFWPFQATRLPVSHLTIDSLSSEMSHIRVVLPANFSSLTHLWLEVQLLVCREKSRGERTQSCG